MVAKDMVGMRVKEMMVEIVAEEMVGMTVKDMVVVTQLNERPFLCKIIQEIPCRANTAREFAFQKRTSDVEEWVNISRQVCDVRPILQIFNADKLQGFKNNVDDSVLMSSNFLQIVYNLFLFSWMEKRSLSSDNK